MNVDLSNIDDVIAELEKADDAYFNSDKELINDTEYDQLKRVAHKLSPKHPYFVKVGADVRGGKLKLPYAMNGLDQIYEGEIQSLWVQKYGIEDAEVVVTDKLDGVSCMLVFADKDGDGNAEFQIAYSRGNSAEGADITRHIKKLQFPKHIPNSKLYVVRAELIMRDDVFRSKFEVRYSSARATVAGAMNSSDSDDRVDNIDLVAYSVVDTSGKRNSKSYDLEMLSDLGFKTPYYQTLPARKLSDALLLDCLNTAKGGSVYELDGIVLTVNHTGQSVKYKVLDANSVIETTVRAVHWEISKWGLLKPRVEINPVRLHDTIVTFATGHNAKFIMERRIMPGSLVKIFKAGSVIPQIL